MIVAVALFVQRLRFIRILTGDGDLQHSTASFPCLSLALLTKHLLCLCGRTCWWSALSFFMVTGIFNSVFKGGYLCVDKNRQQTADSRQQAAAAAAAAAAVTSLSHVSASAMTGKKSQGNYSERCEREEGIHDLSSAATEMPSATCSHGWTCRYGALQLCTWVDLLSGEQIGSTAMG